MLSEVEVGRPARKERTKGREIEGGCSVDEMSTILELLSDCSLVKGGLTSLRGRNDGSRSLRLRWVRRWRKVGGRMLGKKSRGRGVRRSC